MFSFDLPKFAALQVSLPTGGGAIMVHVGGGRFISKVPPIALAGLVPAAEPAQNVEGLPVAWDGATLPGDGESAPVYFAFDVASAQRSVEEAAAAGDTFAKAILTELDAAQRTLDARAKLGVMDAAPAGDDSRSSDPVPVSGAAGD